MEMMEYLLQRGAAVDAQNKIGNTPLHILCECVPLEMVQRLVEQGHADIHIRNDNGCTPMETARIKENIAIVLYLTRLQKRKKVRGSLQPAKL
jgi:ankyrin repeat protein